MHAILTGHVRGFQLFQSFKRFQPFKTIESRRSAQGQAEIVILLKNPWECFDGSQHERKILNLINSLPVRPETLEG